MLRPTGGTDVGNRTNVGNQKPKSRNFFKKFIELQLLMVQHNAGLTASHPYASSPINWPFLLSGISFWTQNDGQKQVYLIGNIIGWWTCVVAISTYIGIVGADLIARRRGVEPLHDCKSPFNTHPKRALTEALLQPSATDSGTRRASSSSSGRCTTSRSTS